ncbi:minichromosome maintenance domain-containing protein 2 [Nerophis lumbriciformis]|uniref:minichromosome maintenance domain-containing protein 2 n=1 Tax=Nerophis lumbriciformis TaxID=546530 RepID=UPI002AE03C93|nr:minichromosome maintenance domain-containing protein 2-like [Nerophis lumbriciformis]XP_061821376.1 minichromosome maintenance domain-containing protein 2-like [Nerophis lumbriciformis]
MADMFSLKRSVLIYLDKSGGLQKLTEDCKSFNDPQQNAMVIFRFCVGVNPTDVIEVDPDLGDRILHHPLNATALFQSVCFLAIKTLSLIESVHTECQVNVILKLTHLPPFPDYKLDLAAFPRTHCCMRPMLMEGLAIAVTRVTKYTRGARFLCSNDDCHFSSGFHHIRVHAPGATESATVRNDFSCMACSSPLKEDIQFRVLGDKQLVELIHVDALKVLSAHQQSPLRYQSVTLFLRDELCNTMRIGQLYRVIGIPAHVHQWPNITWSVEVNNVQPWEPQYPHDINAKFKQLLKATGGSHWRFAAVIAHCFDLNMTPPGLYHTLKLSLLLSLVQTRGDAKNTSHLNLLVTAGDTIIVERLMKYSLNLSCRGVRHEASREMFASLSHDEHGAGTANIYAGSALLANGGICMLGDLSSFRKDKLDAIESVLDSRTVSVFIPGKKYGKDADQHLTFPISCSFWALADSTQNSRRTYDAVLGAVEMGPVPPQLAASFGLIVKCQDPAKEHAVLSLTVHTLQQAVQPGKYLYSSLDFSTQDYKELVAYAQSLQVDLSPAAQKLIRGYFMATCRVRSQIHSNKMSAAFLKLLISLAEAHCKLSLRSEVLEEDAVIAVLLYENSVTLKNEGSALVIPPDALFPPDLGEDGLLRRDRALDELHQNILRFIYTYALGADEYITEE